LVQADVGATGRRTWNKQDEQAYDPTCCCGPEDCYMNMQIGWGGTLLTYTYTYSPSKYLDTFKVLLPTDAQDNCCKSSIKIYIKTAPTCFGVITIIRECTI